MRSLQLSVSFVLRFRSWSICHSWSPLTVPKKWNYKQTNESRRNEIYVRKMPKDFYGAAIAAHQAEGAWMLLAVEWVPLMLWRQWQRYSRKITKGVIEESITRTMKPLTLSPVQRRYPVIQRAGLEMSTDIDFLESDLSNWNRRRTKWSRSPILRWSFRQLQANGIEPVITLSHFWNALCPHEEFGGFANKKWFPSLSNCQDCFSTVSWQK